MATIGDLQVNLSANSAVFVQQLAAAREAVERTATATERGLGAMRSAFGVVGAGLAGFIGGLSAARIVEFGRETVRAAGQIGELAEQLSVSSDALQVYRFAAGQAGVSARQLETGLQRFAALIGEAGQGNRTAIATFERLGVKLIESSGQLRGVEAVLADVANRFAAIESPATRAAFATELFGRGGARMVTVIGEGAQGLGDFEAQARRTGHVIDEDLIRRADRLSDQWEANANAIQHFMLPSFVLLFEALDAVGRKLIELGNAMARWIAPNELQRAEDAVQSLERQLEQAERRLQQMRAQGNTPAGLVGVEVWTRQVEQLRAQLDAALAALGALQGRSGDSEGARPPSAVASDAPPGVRNPTPRGGARRPQLTESQRQTADIERFVAGLDREARANEELSRGIGMVDAALSRQIVTQEQADELYGRVQERYRETRIAAAGLSEAITRSQDPFERYADQLDELNQLLADNVISETEFTRAQREMERQLTQSLMANNGLNDAVRSLGFSFTSAFENAIVKGESLRSVLGSLLQDIGKIIVRIAVTTPLANALTSGLSRLVGSYFGGAGSGAGGSGSHSAMGNVVGARGPVPLQRFAMGGVVDSPHVALFGEGSTPEAFVPLPDGRAIPVNLRGGAGHTAVVLNIDARGAAPGVELRIRAAADDAVRRAIAAIPVLARAGGQYARDIGARKR